MPAQQPGIVERQHDGKHAAERGQRGKIEIAAVLEPASMKIVTMKNVWLGCQGGRDPPGAGKIKILEAPIAMPLSMRLAHE